MMQFTLDDETKLIELLKLLLSGQQYKLLLTKNDEPIANITLEKEMTDAEKIQEWARLNKIKQPDEVVTTKNGNPVLIKESELEDLIKTQPRRKSGFGIAKDKWNLPPDFDEWFDAMDAEILADFSDDPDCEF